MSHLAYLTKLPSFAIDDRFTHAVAGCPYSHDLNANVGFHSIGLVLAKDRFQ